MVSNSARSHRYYTQSSVVPGTKASSRVSSIIDILLPSHFAAMTAFMIPDFSYLAVIIIVYYARRQQNIMLTLSGVFLSFVFTLMLFLLILVI